MTDDRPDAIQRFQQSGFSYPFRITQPVEALLALRTALGLPTVGRALVFGCSGGEEVLTVAALLPDAEILGCDVDEEALRLAGSSLRLPHARVVRSDWGAIRDNGPYDLITCNAVLCLHPQDTKIDDISAALPFGRIDEILHGLLGVLAPGGVLFAGDCNYPPGLSHAAKALWPVSLRGFNGNHEGVWSGTVERYGADGRKFATRFLSPRLIAFPGFRAVRPMPLDLEAAMLDRAWLRPPVPAAGLPAEVARLEVSRPVPAAWSSWERLGGFERELGADFPDTDGLFALRTAIRTVRGPEGRVRVVREDAVATPDGRETLTWTHPVRMEPGEAPSLRFRAKDGLGAWSELGRAGAIARDTS